MGQADFVAGVAGGARGMRKTAGQGPAVEYFRYAGAVPQSPLIPAEVWRKLCFRQRIQSLPSQPAALRATILLSWIPAFAGMRGLLIQAAALAALLPRDLLKPLHVRAAVHEFAHGA